ncbi:unnamed protein product [Rhizoctonia solani]|uniref:Uncharacterized protein n=1 Tax=Rhizoctonia solani TaxID=456999 RepID=A0A8H3D8S4_9AGAM|nr:unnamed protein product [Rhizoctonia solani]
MTLPDTIQNHISALEIRLSETQDKLDGLREAERFEEYEKVRDEEFIGLFKDTCALVREAELAGSPYLIELAKAVGKILDDGIRYSYGRDSVYDFMPSWAHDEDRPLIKDEIGENFPLSHNTVNMVIQAFQSCSADFSNFITEPWDAKSKRHQKSANLSRFRSNLPALTSTLDNPSAATILDARCEISSSRCVAPLRFLKSTGNTCLALTATSGYGNRSPTLEYLFPNQPLAPSVKFPTVHQFEPKLNEVPIHGAIDEIRRLIVVGDDCRIKSYEWGSSNGEVHKHLLPIHNLASKSSRGPMALLPNGSLVRAGQGGASVFDLQVPTYGSDGNETIGELIEDVKTMRSDFNGIELSSGSAPTSHIKFFDQPNIKPHIWQPLLAAPSTFLCAGYGHDEGKYGCVGIDLEAGKTTSYHLGHGANVSDFSVSLGEPQLFLTACNDGFARLFDMRLSLPVLTFDACGQNECCDAVALAHPDGIPIMFTGTGRGEQIKVWDVRARACVYELATGNNAVQSVAWDGQNNCLYAATECRYMDRLGYHHDYRYAKIPNNQRFDDEDEDYCVIGRDAKDYYKDGERCWPKSAWHKEDYFGYLYDAGGHQILRYAFKEDPDRSAVPKYGDASRGSAYW